MRSRAPGSVLLVLLGGGLLLSPWMGAVPLLDQDEPRFAECSRQMLVTGDWVYPQFNGRPRHAKPPLFNWVQAMFYRVLGVSEFSARLPSLLATIATGLVLYLFAAAHRGHASGLLALLVWFALPQTHLWARMSVVDPLLTLVTTVALVAAFNGSREAAGRRWWWYVLAGVAMGLATMTKGPVGVVVPGFAYLLYALASRTFRTTLGHGGPWLALLLAIAIAAPWFAAQIAHYGGEYTGRFFGFDNVQRYTKARDSLGPLGWLWPVPVVLFFAFPFSVLLPAAIRDAFRDRSRARQGSPDASWRLYLAACVIAVAVIFAFSATRLPQYFMALYPAMAMLIGDALASLAAGDERPRGRGVVTALLVVGSLFAIAFGYGASQAAEWVPKAKLDSVPLMAAVAGALAVAFAVGGLLAPLLWRLGRPRTAVAGLLGAGLLVSLAIGNLVWPCVGLERDQGKKELSLVCRETMVPDVPVIAYGLHTSTVVFYSHHPCLEIEKRDSSALLAAIDSYPGARVIMHRAAWPEMDPDNLEIVAESRQYVLAKPVRQRFAGGTHPLGRGRPQLYRQAPLWYSPGARDDRQLGPVSLPAPLSGVGIPPSRSARWTGSGGTGSLEDVDNREEAGTYSGVSAERRRHRISGSTDRPPDSPHQPAERASEGTHEGPPQPPWLAATRRQAQAAADISA